MHRTALEANESGKDKFTDHEKDGESVPRNPRLPQEKYVVSEKT